MDEIVVFIKYVVVIKSVQDLERKQMIKKVAAVNQFLFVFFSYFFFGCKLIAKFDLNNRSIKYQTNTIKTLDSTIKQHPFRDIQFCLLNCFDHKLSIKEIYFGWNFPVNQSRNNIVYNPKMQ